MVRVGSGECAKCGRCMCKVLGSHCRHQRPLCLALGTTSCKQEARQGGTRWRLRESSRGPQQWGSRSWLFLPSHSKVKSQVWRGGGKREKLTPLIHLRTLVVWGSLEEEETKVSLGADQGFDCLLGYVGEGVGGRVGSGGWSQSSKPGIFFYYLFRDRVTH